MEEKANSSSKDKTTRPDDKFDASDDTIVALDFLDSLVTKEKHPEYGEIPTMQLFKDHDWFRAIGLGGFPRGKAGYPALTREQHDALPGRRDESLLMEIIDSSLRPSRTAFASFLCSFQGLWVPFEEGGGIFQRQERAFLDTLATRSFLSYRLFHQLLGEGVKATRVGATKFHPGVGPAFIAEAYELTLQFTGAEDDNLYTVPWIFHLAHLNQVDFILGLDFIGEHELGIKWNKPEDNCSTPTVNISATVGKDHFILAKDDDELDHHNTRILHSLLKDYELDTVLHGRPNMPRPGLERDLEDLVAMILQPDLPHQFRVSHEESEFYKSMTKNQPEFPKTDSLMALQADGAALRMENTKDPTADMVPRKAIHGMLPCKLNQRQQAILNHYIKVEFCDVFGPYKSVPTERVPGESFKFHLKEGAEARSFQPPRLPPDKLKGAKEIIEKLLEQEFLVESDSAWGSPMLCVYKHGADGKVSGYRAVFDYRYINSVTEPFNWPLPRIDDLLHSLGQYKVYSGADLMDGFYSLPVDPASQDMTTVTTPFGVYKWRVLPMGVRNGPSYFSSFVSRAFKNVKGAHVYIDDVGLGAHSIDEQLECIHDFLTTCRKEKVQLKESKCFWCYQKIAFLGHLISHNQLHPMQKHLEAIHAWEQPENRKQVSSFLGLCNYYRDYIKDYGKIAQPLYKWTSTSKSKGKETVQWDTSLQTSFETLKQALLNAPVLAVYNPDASHRLYTDASSLIGMGAVLEQQLPGETSWKPLGYFSRKWTEAQSRYHVAAKEMLAIVSSISHFAHWLQSRKHFDIYTDSSACSYYLSKSSAQLDQREIRWLDFLADYNFSIHHVKGELNVVADILSREEGLTSGLSLRVVDLYAGSPTMLRALQKICHQHDVCYLDYQAVERDERCRQTISQVHQALMQDPRVPITADPWRLGTLVDHNVELLDPKHSLVKKYLNDADLVAAGSPCQPWSRASHKPLGFQDPREGFSKLMMIRKHIKNSYFFENVPFHARLTSQLHHIEDALGEHQEILCNGSQQRTRWIFSNLKLKSQLKPSRTWKQCLQAAAAHANSKPATLLPQNQHRSRSFSLMASPNTWSERPGECGSTPMNWVMDGERGVARSMNCLEREALVGLEFEDTKTSRCSIEERVRQCGNAVPVECYQSLVQQIVTRKLGTVKVQNCDEKVSRLGKRNSRLDLQPSTASLNESTHQKQIRKETLFALHEAKSDLVYLRENDPLLPALKEYHKQHGHMAITPLTDAFHEAVLNKQIPTMENQNPSKSLVRDVAQLVVSTCRYCQTVKGKQLAKTKLHLLPYPSNPRPWSEVQVDISTGWTPTEAYNFSQILIVKDRLTGHIDALPCTANVTAGALMLMLHQMFCRWGFPSKVWADDQFKNTVLEQYREEYGLSFEIIPPDHHARLGEAERAVKTVQDRLRAALQSAQEAEPGFTESLWSILLPDVLRWLNNQASSKLHMNLSSNEAVLGRNIHPAKEPDLRRDWDLWFKAVEDVSRETYANKKRRIDEANQERVQEAQFQVGDQVMLRRSRRVNKHTSLWYGPFVIQEILEHDTYKLANGLVRHISSLNAYKEDVCEFEHRHDNVCAVCGVGGNLLLCEAPSCTTAVHASCLALTNAELQDCFYCTSCSIARSVGRSKALSESELRALEGSQNTWRTEPHVLELITHLKGGKPITVDLCCSSKDLSVVDSERWFPDAVSALDSEVNSDDLTFVNPPFTPHTAARKLVDAIVDKAKEKQLLHTLVFIVPPYLKPEGSTILHTYPIGSKLFYNGDPRPSTRWPVYICDFSDRSAVDSSHWAKGQLSQFDHYLLMKPGNGPSGYSMLCCRVDGPTYEYDYCPADHEESIQKYASQWTIAARKKEHLHPGLRHLWPSKKKLSSTNKKNLFDGNRVAPGRPVVLPWTLTRDPSRSLLGSTNFNFQSQSKRGLQKIPLAVWALRFKYSQV